MFWHPKASFVTGLCRHCATVAAFLEKNWSPRGGWGDGGMGMGMGNMGQ